MQAAMIWIGGRCWKFPGARIDTDSWEGELRSDGKMLLHDDTGAVIEGIEVAEPEDISGVFAVPLPEERRRREIMLARLMLVAIDIVLAGDPKGRSKRAPQEEPSAACLRAHQTSGGLSSRQSKARLRIEHREGRFSQCPRLQGSYGTLAAIGTQSETAVFRRAVRSQSVGRLARRQSQDAPRVGSSRYSMWFVRCVPQSNPCEARDKALFFAAAQREGRVGPPTMRP